MNSKPRCFFTQVQLKYLAARPLWWIAEGLYNPPKQTCPAEDTSKAGLYTFGWFPWPLHATCYSLLFCCSLNRQKSSSAFRGWDKLACNPACFRWLFHLYTDSVPLSHPARPCNERRAQRSFDLIYRLPVLFSASSKQPFETCPQKWSCNHSHATDSCVLLTSPVKEGQKEWELFWHRMECPFMPVWFFMGVFLVFLSGRLHHTVKQNTIWEEFEWARC